MSRFNTVRAGAKAAIEEIIQNARAQQPFRSFITNQASELFHYADGKPDLKREITKLLQLGSPDPAVVHRGLVIQLNGIFEGFIKSLVTTHISAIAVKVSRFNELEAGLQSSYAVHAARTLSKLQDGAINGIKYDFVNLQKGLGSCFAGNTPFNLNGEVFTLTMGNCTPDRLRKLFEQIGLMDPFGDQLGKHSSIQRWCKEGKARRAASRAEEELSTQIGIRNDLVHGFTTKNIVLNDVEMSALFFQALVDAYSDLADDLH